MSGAENTPRYVIAGGGTPTGEQLAAIAVALTPVAVASGDRDGKATPPAWLRAALHEGVGGRPMTTAEDLQELWL